jgi:hypothetical protein
LLQAVGVLEVNWLVAEVQVDCLQDLLPLLKALRYGLLWVLEAPVFLAKLILEQMEIILF